MSKLITPKFNFHTLSLFHVSSIGPNTSSASASHGTYYFSDIGLKNIVLLMDKSMTKLLNWVSVVVDVHELRQDVLNGARSGDKDGQSRKLVSYNVSVVIRFSVCALAFSCWYMPPQKFCRICGNTSGWRTSST